MGPPPPPRRIIPLLAAVAGVVLAHALDYALVFPRAGARDGHLQATGHAYWPVVVAAAAAAGALALIVVAAHGARRGRAAPEAACAGADVRLGWLLFLQVGAFVVMEAGERGLAGLPPSVLLQSAEFWLGLALQLPVAWLARRVLGAVDEVAHRIAARLSRRPGRRAPSVLRLPAFVSEPVAAVAASAARPRAPPRSLAFA